MNVFVADDDVRFLQELDTPVPDGETVAIIPAVAGGMLGVSTRRLRVLILGG